MSFTATVLQEAILNTQNSAGYGVASSELRRSRYGALEAYKMGTDKVMPASTLRTLREATTQLTKIDVFDRVVPGLGELRKCFGVGTGNTVRTDVNYNGFTEEFALSFEEHQGNETKYQETFNHLLNEKLKALHNRIDSAAIVHLEANKATGGGAGTLFAADTDPDDKAVPLADHSRFFNAATVEMEQNDFSGPFMNVSSTSQKELQRFDAQQGSSNDENLAFMQNDYIHFPSNRLAPAALSDSSSYLVDPGAIGLITWTNAISRIGKTSGSDIWTSMQDPYGLLGNIELKISSSCFDNSGAFSGADADFVETFVLHVDVAFVAAYDSVLGAPIFKYNLKTA